MPLHLRIENETVLPDGGPTAITVTPKRGVDIGRDQYLDWVLPDPTRTISGKHAEIRYRDGGYWITDTSTNGTFVNRSEFSIDGAHLIRSGDRIEIGKYIIQASVEPDMDSAPAPDGGVKSSEALWDIAEGTNAPAEPAEARRLNVSRPIAADPLDWLPDFADPVPSPASRPAPTRPAPAPPQAADPFDLDFEPPRKTPDTLRPVSPRELPPASLPDPFAPAAAADLRPAAGAVQAEGDERMAPAAQAAREAPAPAAPPSFDPTPPVTPAAMPVASPLPPPAAAPRPQTERAAPAPARPPTRAPAAAAASVLPGGDYREAFARGAGIDPGSISLPDDAALAELAGTLVRILADNLMQLHQARAKSKGIMRSSNMTLIQAKENNPLRFSPTAADALRILLGPPTLSYLSAEKAVQNSFEDQKKHQTLVFSAMQQALIELLDDLNPKKLEASLPAEGGVGGLLRSKQARLWERYQTVWDAKSGKSDNGMIDVFMRLFAEAYDRSS